MGILAGFIGGASRAAGEIANQRIARYTAEELARQRDLMDQEREKRIEEAQIARENRAVSQRDKDRTDMVKRIDGETSRIADAEIAKQQGLIFQKDAAPSLTPERLDEIDRELAAKRESIISDQNTRFKASVNTGDTSQKEAQAFFDSTRRLDQAEKHNTDAAKNAEMRDATQRYIADLRDKDAERKDATANRRIEALIRNANGNGGNKDKDVLSFLSETRKALTSESNRLQEAMNGELASVKFDPDAQAKIRAEYKPKFNDIEIQQKKMAADFNFARQKLGLPKEEESKSSPTESKDPLAAGIEAKLKELRAQKSPQSQSQIADPGSPTASTPAGRGGLISPKPTVDTSARDAEIARMNSLSGSSSNRANTLSKKQDEIATSFDDKLSQIKPGMARQEAFKVLSWFDENSGYMTPAQLKQVRDAKRAAGM